MPGQTKPGITANISSVTNGTTTNSAKDSEQAMQMSPTAARDARQPFHLGNTGVGSINLQKDSQKYRLGTRAIHTELVQPKKTESETGLKSKLPWQSKINWPITTNSAMDR